MKQKHKIKWHRNTYYYLGMDRHSINYYMEDFAWDCECWYGGWIVSFSDNNKPERSRDMDSHTHFDTLILKGPNMYFDNFNENFVSSPLYPNDIWKLCELMKEFYLLRDYAKFCKFGHCGVTDTIDCNDNINITAYETVNKIIMPKLFDKIREVLTK